MLGSRDASNMILWIANVEPYEFIIEIKFQTGVLLAEFVNTCNRMRSCGGVGT